MGNFRNKIMRQLLIILTIVLFCNNLFAQTDECQSGIDSANVDFSNGILRTYIFGLTNSFTYGKLLKSEYGIDAIYADDIVVEKWDCYSKFMNEKIKEKFGNDIFENVATKVKKGGYIHIHDMYVDLKGKGLEDICFKNSPNDHPDIINPDSLKQFYPTIYDQYKKIQDFE